MTIVTRLSPSLIQTDRIKHPQLKDILRTKEQALKHISNIKEKRNEQSKQEKRNEQSKQELRKECGLHERHNPLFDLQVDLYRYA